MRRNPGVLSAMTMLAVCVSLALGGCSKKDGTADEKDKAAAEPKIDWPQKPADGSPVAIEFLGLAGKGDRVKAKVRMFNFGEKDVNRVTMTLHYLDESGKELKSFPWSQMQNPKLIDGKDVVEKKIGAFLPAETKTVKATLEEVSFTDDTTWKAPAE